jgi:proline racemase
MQLLPSVVTTDYHTGGEPFRIVAEPPVPLPGDSVADRRARAITSSEAQELRRLLSHEPRGHADMYGGFVVPPDDDGADLGVLFWHKDGFSTACGHGTIALGAWAVDVGLVTAPDDGSVDVTIDVPSGRVTARVRRTEGRTVEVEFVSVPSFVIGRTVEVPTTHGPVPVDVSFGGAIYAQVPAERFDLSVIPEHVDALISAGREVKQALEGTAHARHPDDDRLSGVYGTVLYDDLGTTDDGRLRQRNVTIFADGQVDRSPCGSGTAARIATLAAEGRLAAPEAVLVHESIVGSVFVATRGPGVEVDGRAAVVPSIVGTAFRTGEHVFHVDPHDDLVPGFVFR